MKVAFIGLGVMGYPMAGHLARAGHDVTVYNRTKTKAEAWVNEFKGRSADTPSEAVAGAEIVFTCVGNDNDLEQVVCSEHGILSSLSAGAILVDHTTASAQIAREMAEYAAEQQAFFMDAPVSGGQAGAENGVLSVMLGGDESSYERIIPLIDCYSQAHRLLGGHGAGQLAKMVNQICVAGLLQGLAEGVHFAQKSGVDPEAIFDVIQHGAAGSWQMTNRSQSMIEDRFDFGFAVDWMRKDLNIALQEARHNGAQLPMTALIDQFYAELQQQGEGRSDTSVLLKRFK